MTTLAAYYYPSRHGAMIRIERLANGRRECVMDAPCKGKREAREIAKQHGATPWNF